MIRAAAVILVFALCGCAHLYDYDGQHANALTYHEPVAYLMVTRGPDCTVQKAELVSFPGKARSLEFDPGLAGGQLSVTLNNGMIATMGQSSESDTAPVMSAAGSLISAAGPLAALAKRGQPKAARCAGVSLEPIDAHGRPDVAQAIIVD